MPYRRRGPHRGTSWAGNAWHRRRHDDPFRYNYTHLHHNSRNLTTAAADTACLRQKHQLRGNQPQPNRHLTSASAGKAHPHHQHLPRGCRRRLPKSICALLIATLTLWPQQYTNSGFARTAEHISCLNDDNVALTATKLHVGCDDTWATWPNSAPAQQNDPLQNYWRSCAHLQQHAFALQRKGVPRRQSEKNMHFGGSESG